MLHALDEADWCDIQGLPVARPRRPARRTPRRKPNQVSDSKWSDKSIQTGTVVTRLKRISQLLFRFGILGVTFVYCAGSQFLTLRRLTVAETNTNDIAFEPIVTTDSIMGQPRVGNSLLGRIQTESMLANRAIEVTRTSGQTATRTRRLGPGAKRKTNFEIGNWPVLPTQTTHSDNSNTRTVTRKRTLGTLSSVNTNNKHNNAEPFNAAGSVANAKNPDYDGLVTTTATATRTRSTRLSSSFQNRLDKSRKRHIPTQDDEFQQLGDYKILGFTDYNFREVALQWYHRLQDLGYHEHVLVVYDNAMADFLQSLNEERSYELSKYENTNTTQAPARNEESPTNHEYYRFEKCILPPLPKSVLRLRRDERQRHSLEMMTAQKWRYIWNELQTGTSILLTDVDTIFHQHVDLTNESDFSHYDALLSYNGHEQEEFPIHAGAMWLKSKPSTIQFVQKLVETCKEMCNSQIVLNELIADQKALGMEWDEDDSADETADEIPMVASQSRTGRSTVSGLTVKVWDRNWVFRGLDCPHTQPWLAIPVANPRGSKLASSSAQTLALLDAWNNGCEKQRIA